MLYKKLMILGLFLCFSLAKSEAQEQRFKAGVIFGTTLSQIDGDQSAGYIKLGLTGGIRGVAILSEKSELSIELLFDQRGSRSQSIFDEDFFPFKITTNYVSVPVVFNYKDWLSADEEYYKLHFHAGLSYGRLLNSNIDDEDQNSIFLSVSEFFEKDDLSFLIGATFYTSPHIAITGRFNRGLLPLFDNSIDDGRPAAERPLVSKFLTLQCLYMF